MKMVEIWMCEAKFSSDEYAKFGKRKKDAEKLQANAFGYCRIQDAVKDGWAKRAIKISVPEPVAEVLLG